MSQDLQAEVFSLAAALEADLERLTDMTFRHLEEPLPDELRELPLWEEVRAFTRDSIQAELQTLKIGAEPPERCPEIDAYGARRGAETGTPLRVLLDGYRAGHRAQWEAWWSRVDGADGMPDPRRASLLQYGSSFFFRYAARLSALVTDEYMAARERVLASREQRRMLLVRDLLDGRDVDAGALEYPLERHHLGCVVWGTDSHQTARDLAAHLDGRLLLLGAGPQVGWVWIGLRDASVEAATALLSRFPLPADSRVAVGGVYPGREGFRRTHRQALAAYRAATRFGRTFVTYRDIALEHVASRDEEVARDFVAAELGGLSGEDPTSRKLRTTVLAYFVSGQNARRAARRLGVHHQTVTARLRAAEARVGYPIARRRLELELALRLARFLGP